MVVVVQREVGDPFRPFFPDTIVRSGDGLAHAGPLLWMYYAVAVFPLVPSHIEQFFNKC